jgi:tRNA pseudouridine38-40 synthase
MPRFFIVLAFNGGRYHGWQVQPNAHTVQEVIDAALSTLLRENISTLGAGRTDTGVHASYFVAHFDSINLSAKAGAINNNKFTEFISHLNRYLPWDITCKRIIQVKDDAHARFDAISRTYQYHISTTKNPFTNGFALYWPYVLDVNKMNAAAALLKEYSDFTSFAKKHSDAKTNRCKVFLAYWQQKDEILVFTISADRFLRNMVRAITGTLLEVGRNKITLDDFRKIIDNKNRGNAGESIAAEGLYLVDIEYPIGYF